MTSLTTVKFHGADLVAVRGELPNRELRDCRGFIYAILFKDGLVKVGSTIHPRRRIAQHTRSIRNLNLEGPVTAVVTTAHFGFRENEQVLIKQLGSPAHRGEWFAADFNAVVSIISSLTLHEAPLPVDADKLERMNGMFNALMGRGVRVRNCEGESEHDSNDGDELPETMNRDAVIAIMEQTARETVKCVTDCINPYISRLEDRIKELEIQCASGGYPAESFFSNAHEKS